MRRRVKRTDRLPTAGHRPTHLRSEGFQEMAQRVEKQARAPESAYKGLRGTARVDPPERHPVRWTFVGLAGAGLGSAAFFYWEWVVWAWDWVIGLFS